MRKYLLCIFIVICSNFVASAHPVHVSVVNISIEGDILEITIATFVDDWEVAHFHFYGDTLNLKSRKNFEGEWFNSYLEKSLHIDLNKKGNPLTLVKDTIYFNDLSMTIEMHAKLTDKAKTLYIYNAILTDIYTDQTNLLIFSNEGKEKGVRFDYKKKQEELKLR
ncbi:MAG: hypothetical protein PF450_01110 [Bacteroidales bacterium]|jgi:hypothetical protein|nr:hypothetical protein [Bacteroidales bacterium]